MADKKPSFLEGAIPADQAPSFLEGAIPVDEEIINERAPEISVADRAIVKNLVSNPEAAFNFLQKKYPTLELKKDESGEIVARPRGAKEFRRLDPKGFDPEDVLDLGADVGQGTLETVAGTLGSAAGPLGAAGAAGAASAATEYGKQKLAEALGVENPGDASDVALSGALGAGGPLLFGAGEIKSPVMQGAKKLASKIASGASGIEEPILKAAYQNVEKLGTKAGSQEAANIAKDVSEEVLSKSKAAKDAAGSELGKLYDNFKGTVDLSSVGERAKGLLEKYRKNAVELGTDAAKRDYEFVQKTLLDHLPAMGAKEPASRAFKIADTALNKLSGVRRSVESTGKEPVERDIINFAKQSAKDIGEKLDKATPGLRQAKDQYKSSLALLEQADNYFGDAKSAERSLRTIFSPTKDVEKTAIKDLAKGVGADIEGRANLASAIKEFSNPSWLPPSKNAVTATLKGAAGGAAGVLGARATGNEDPTSLIGAGLLGAAASSPRAILTMMKAAKMAEKAAPLSEAARAAYGQRGTWEQLLGGK